MLPALLLELTGKQIAGTADSLRTIIRHQQIIA
jgi:hypothetical protein